MTRDVPIDETLAGGPSPDDAGLGSVMSASRAFSFEDRALRVVDGGGDPWFVLQDVCEILGIQNPSDMAKRVPADEIRVGSIHGGNHHRRMTLVSAPGLYRVVLKSRKPEAEAFSSWVFKEILPTIGGTGGHRLGGGGPRPDRRPPEALLRDVRAVVAHLVDVQDVMSGALDRARRMLDVILAEADAAHRAIVEGHLATIAALEGRVRALEAELAEAEARGPGLLPLPGDPLLAVEVAGEVVAFLLDRGRLAAFPDEAVRALAAETLPSLRGLPLVVPGGRLDGEEGEAWRTLAAGAGGRLRLPPAAASRPGRVTVALRPPAPAS